MDDLEVSLKSFIISNYGSLKKFTDEINMPWTTLDSILKRGVMNASIGNIMKVCRHLDISVDALARGRIKLKENPLNGITAEEYDFIKKYRRLSPNTKIIVNGIIDAECDRIVDSSAGKSKGLA